MASYDWGELSTTSSWDEPPSAEIWFLGICWTFVDLALSDFWWFWGASPYKPLTSRPTTLGLSGKTKKLGCCTQKWGDSHKHLTSETAGNLSKAESRQPFHHFRDRFWFTLGVGIGLFYISQKVWRCSTNSAPPNTEIGRSTFMMSWIRSCTWEKGWVCSNERLRKDARY